MDFADILLKRIDGEKNLKKPVKALVCFSQPIERAALGNLIINMLKSKPENSSIVALYLMDETQNVGLENDAQFKAQLFAELIEACEKNNIGIRTLLKVSADFVSDALAIAQDYDCNFLLTQVDKLPPDAEASAKYLSVAETGVDFDSQEKTSFSMKSVSALLRRNTVDTGIFMENNFTIVDKIFTPLLHKDDISVFPYLFQIAQLPNVQVTVWDAIGIIATDPKVQKVYQYINKKTDNSVLLWNNEKKIDHNFIEQQNLVIIGITGWNKLITSAISWNNFLPSTLIIQDETNI